ncbi:hypothetical protein [Streptomyces prasinus]
MGEEVGLGAGLDEGAVEGEPAEDPLSGVPLLGRRVRIRPQDLVDQRLAGIEP